MAFEPINIFSHRIDVRGVAELLRGAAAADVEVLGPDDDWEQIVVVATKGGFFRKAKVVTFGHDADYYDGPDWPNQVMGMQGYFSRFPDCPAKTDVMRLIRSFRFSLAVPQEDLNIDSDDARLQVIYNVCRHLDGVIFTPSSLRDASGRILINSQGESDPNAAWPTLPPTEDHPDAVDEEFDDEDDEDDWDPEPPTAERVARRALALTAVAARATLEMDAAEMDDADVHRKRIVAWIEELGVGDELEPDEWKVLQRPAGTLDQQAFIDSMWRVEGLAVLSWALHLHDLPPYDELVIPPDLYDSIGLFDVEAGQRLLAEPNLRSAEELNGLQEHLLAFHWRVRDYSLRPEPMDFVAFSHDCWFGSFDIEHFRVIDGDMAIGDTSISDAPPEEFSRVQSTAMERHQAINWLQGYSEIYSETDTST